jgi:CRP/FNR family transcriptional regulator, cyclic AMP receptor protein
MYNQGMNALSDLLAKNPIFSQLDAQQQIALIQGAISRDYSKNHRITHYGDTWPYLFLVEQGRVTAVKESAEGRSLIIVSIGPGEIFWGAAFFQEYVPMLAALVAGEDSRIHLWSRKKMLPILLENGKMSWELSRLMVSRMQRASDIVDVLAFQPVAGRLARFLMDHFGDREKERIARDMTLDEMAAHIGSTREMVSRILHRFSNEGIIEITRTEFVFTDREGLKQLAQNAND